MQLLTVGNSTYSNDNRLAIAWRYPGNWTLQINSVDLLDTGCYQCQVNTHPPIGLFVYLEVLGEMLYNEFLRFAELSKPSLVFFFREHQLITHDVR